MSLGEPCGEERLLEDLDELLYRQIPPSQIEDGDPAVAAFCPTKDPAKDANMLSIDLSSLSTAEEAYDRRGPEKSEGTWAVTVGEAAHRDEDPEKHVGLNSYRQVACGNPAHGFIDFRGLPRKTKTAKAAVLRSRALDRKRIHPPLEDAQS